MLFVICCLAGLLLSGTDAELNDVEAYYDRHKKKRGKDNDKTDKLFDHAQKVSRKELNKYIKADGYTFDIRKDLYGTDDV